MLAEKILNLLMLNEEMVMANLLANGEGQMETNMLYLDNGAGNHITGVRAKFKEFDEKFIKNVKLCDRSIVLIKGKKKFILF